jgi:hypothetical protein
MPPMDPANRKKPGRPLSRPNTVILRIRMKSMLVDELKNEAAAQSLPLTLYLERVLLRR